MAEVTPISSRKADHIRINLEEDVRSGLSTGLERYRFIHRAVPECNLDEIQLGQELFGRRVDAPLLISSMTGGAPAAAQINRTLALAAQERRIAMGVGSQRAALQHPELAGSFQVRRYAPDILLFANLGAVQLNYGFGPAECCRAVEMIAADALILHFNPLQEALQPEGDTRWAGILEKVRQVCQALPAPVIAKEVGWGFSKEDVWALAQAGVAGFDVAGAGGTSWSQVEMHRAQSERRRRLAAAFVDWGVPTAEALQNVTETAPELALIASGGLRGGVDVAKCLALGARLGGLAAPFLKAAAGGEVAQVLEVIDGLSQEISVCMFASGCGDLPTLHQGRALHKRELGA